MRIVVYIFLLLILLLLLFAGVSPWFLTEDTIRVLADTLSSDSSQQTKIIERFFGNAQISLYRGLSVVLLLSFAAGIWKFTKVSKVLLEITEEIHRYNVRLLKSARKYFQALKSWQKITIGVCIILYISYKIFAAQYYHFIVDEVFSYLYFVDKGLLVTATYYPAPNNHILYLEICSLLNYIIPDPVWVMRLPAAAFGLTLSLILFLVLLRHAGFNTAIIGLVLSIFHPALHYYSLHGRGYILLTLLTFLAGYFLYRWYVYREKNAMWYYILFSILAFYTIPVYLYFFFGFIVMAFIKITIRRSYADGWQIIKACIWIIVVTLLLYSPVILLNGASALVANDWVRSLNIGNEIIPGLPVYIHEVIESGSGLVLGKWELYLLLLLFFIAATVSKSTKVSTLITVLLLASGIFFIQRVFPYVRTWTPLAAGFCMLLAFIITYYMRWLWVQFLFLCVFTGAYLMEFYYFNISKEDYYYKQLYEFVYRINPDQVKGVHARDDSYQLVMRYRFHEENKELKVYTSLTQAIDSEALVIFPVLMNTDITGAGTWEKCYSNNFVDVYKKTGKDVLMKTNE